MSLALATIELSEARHRLFDELAFALKQTDARDIMEWGKVSASRIPKVGARRLKNLGRLAFSLTSFLSNEASLVSHAWRQKQLGGHLVSRTGKGIESAFETGVSVCRFTTAMAVALRDDPQKNASTVLAFALGFFVGSGGLDGNGGIPDTDIAMFGIGNHRSIFTHSVIAGIFVECSILALGDLAGIVCDKLPQNKRSPFWDKISASKDAIAKQLCVGASTGIAYHLAVDATIQPAAYKDLPLSMPMETHQSVFALNSIAEGNDAVQRQKDGMILPNGEKPMMKAEDHINEMKKSANDAVPIFERFLGASWNLLMNAFVSIGVMPIFRRYPWLFAVMMFFAMAAFIPLGILLIAMWFVAHGKGAKGTNNFIVSFEKGNVIQNQEKEREAMVDEAFIRTVEMGYPPETAAKVSEAIGLVFDKTKGNKNIPSNDIPHENDKVFAFFPNHIDNPYASIPTTLNECSSRIKSALWLALQILEKMGGEDPFVMCVYFDVARYHAAINARPTDIPILFTALILSLNCIAELESEAAYRINAKRLQSATGVLTETSIAKLLDLNGRKITSEEQEKAVIFISSGKWDNEMKKFTFSSES